VPVPTPGGEEPERLPAPEETVLQVRRTGGLAGLQQRRTVSLSELPDDVAQAWRMLLVGDRLRALTESGRDHPDAFVYHVACPPDSEEITVPEHGIPEPVRDLFQRTLGL
jgi:hypothetical protein